MTRSFKKGFMGGISLLLASGGEYCYSQTIPFDSDRWAFDAKQSKVEDYLGQKSLLLQSGFAILKDSEFTNGIIEYDVALDHERGYMGAVWHLQDFNNYEDFFMRSHASGKPDANQYTPVFNNLAGWQLYYGEGYGVAIKYPVNEWIHVKIVVSGKQAEVYIIDMDTPALFIHDLKREVKLGKIGLKVYGGEIFGKHIPDFAPAHFANFAYTNVNNPPLKGKAPVLTTPAGAIMSWWVSDTFEEQSLDDKFRLDVDDKLIWKKLSSEYSGLANLASVQGREGSKNTVFAKTTIVSEKEQFKPLQFGYSDRIKVYFNGQLIYRGNYTFGSRDHGFQGTIGFFDELYLPLKKGKNELWMAVSESFGGWGVQAKFADMEGVSIVE